MRIRDGLLWLAGSASVIAMTGAAPVAGPIPPGRQHRLTIEGENTLTFLPRSGLPPLRVDYKAQIEYIVDTRLGKDPRPQGEESPKEESPKEDIPREDVPKKKSSAKSSRSTTKAKAKEGGNPATKVTGAVDLALHSSEILYRQNGQPVLETRISRSRFQGRLQPDSPVMSVNANEAPPRLQEILKNYDTTVAIIQVNSDLRVVDRKFRVEGPQRAVLETISSIHAPMPRDVDSWDLSSRLAMGHGQTAKGMLRYEKVKKTDARPGEPIKVKVSGVLKGEGIVAGNLIKDGNYTVTGEQTYDPQTREWTRSRWSVAVNNELANPAGITVAEARGTMIVESRALDASPAPSSTEPKLGTTPAR